jgi:hypothetical protein
MRAFAVGNYTSRDSFAGLGAAPLASTFYPASWPTSMVCPYGYDPILSEGTPRCREPWQGNTVNPVVATSAPVSIAPSVGSTAGGWIFPPVVVDATPTVTVAAGPVPTAPGISKPLLWAAVAGLGILGLVALKMK